MSDSVNSQESSEGQAGEPGERPRRAYEPPTLTRVGNARELLAGATGSAADTGPPGLKPQQQGG